MHASTMEEELRPHAWLFCPHLGAASEPWLWRQVVGLRDFRCSVITAEHRNKEEYPTPGITIIEDPLLRPRELGPLRWVHRFRNLHTGNFFGFDRHTVKRYLRLANSQPPDVFLCHFGHISVRVAPLARRLDVPLVAHFHGMDLSSSLRNRWYRWSLHQVMGQFDAVIVVGSHQRQVIESMGFPADRTYQIPCGVPVEDFPVAPHHRLDRRTRFITVSRLVPWKGVDVSIRAFAEVRSQGVDAELRIVGDGPQRDELQQLALREAVADRVVFCGSLPQARVQEQLQGSDIFLQHSLEYEGWVEGFGVSITEASATGLPLVVSDCGGIVDQVRDGLTGFVVRQGDVSTMAERMYELAINPELRRSLGTAGRHRVAKMFSARNQIKALEAVLTEVLS